MQVLQCMLKISNYYGTLYVGININVKNQQLLWDPICGYYNQCKKATNYYGTLYVSTTMNVKNQQLLRDFICGYCNEFK